MPALTTTNPIPPLPSVGSLPYPFPLWTRQPIHNDGRFAEIDSNPSALGNLLGETIDWWPHSESAGTGENSTHSVFSDADNTTGWSANPSVQSAHEVNRAQRRLAAAKNVAGHTARAAAVRSTPDHLRRQQSAMTLLTTAVANLDRAKQVFTENLKFQSMTKEELQAKENEVETFSTKYDLSTLSQGNVNDITQKAYAFAENFYEQVKAVYGSFDDASVYASDTVYEKSLIAIKIAQKAVNFSLASANFYSEKFSQSADYNEADYNTGLALISTLVASITTLIETLMKEKLSKGDPSSEGGPSSKRVPSTKGSPSSKVGHSSKLSTGIRKEALGTSRGEKTGTGKTEDITMTQLKSNILGLHPTIYDGTATEQQKKEYFRMFKEYAEEVGRKVVEQVPEVEPEVVEAAPDEAKVETGFKLRFRPVSPSVLERLKRILERNKTDDQKKII